MAQELVTKSAYARRRGVTLQAVSKKTVPRGGIIPVHGPDRLIDVAEADALWSSTPRRDRSTKQPRPAPKPARASSRQPPKSVDPAPAASAADDVLEAKRRSMVAQAETDEIELERLKGSLVDRARATKLAFAFARGIRDSWQNWPARVAPEMAAELGVDQHVLMTVLDQYVRTHLGELAEQPFDL